MKKIMILIGILSFVLVLSGCQYMQTGSLTPLESGCISNEPTTLEGYKAMCSWTIGGESNTKCHLSEGKSGGNSLQVTWGGIADTGEGDVIITSCSEQLMIKHIIPISSMERIRNNIPISSFISPDSIKWYYFRTFESKEYKQTPIVDLTTYYNIRYYPEKNKCTYKKDPRYSTYPCVSKSPYNYFENNTIEECYPNTLCNVFTEIGRCESSNFGDVGQCVVPTYEDFLQGVPPISIFSQLCIVYTDTKIEDKYFETFITCPQLECTTNDDCKSKYNNCFMKCTDLGKCVISSVQHLSPCQYGWLGYPDCKCKSTCTPNWQCQDYNSTQCINSIKTRVCKDLNNCQSDKTEYITCEIVGVQKTFIQKYGLYLLIGLIIIVTLYFGTKKK